MSREQFNPQPTEAERMWDSLPQSVRDLVECQYLARDPKLTKDERAIKIKEGRERLLAMSDRPETKEIENYLNYQAFAAKKFGEMPPLPHEK